MEMIDIFTFIGGFSAKLYDDVDDNKYFCNLKKNIFLRELLKGLHYLSFISTGMKDNLFYLIIYIGNLLHLITNKISFSTPYENSLVYTFSLGLLLLDYNKILDSIKLFKLYSLNTFAVFSFTCFMLTEPLLINREISLIKLCNRVGFTVLSLGLYFMCDMPTIKNIFMYSFGYLICSSFMQYISLREKIKELEKNIQEEKNTEENKKNIEENRENIEENIKEDNIDKIINYVLLKIDESLDFKK